MYSYFYENIKKFLGLFDVEKKKTEDGKKSRLDVQFVKKIPLKMVIGQQMKEEGMIKINNGFYIKLSIHLLLK